MNDSLTEQTQVRRMIRRDMPEVLRIESAAFAEPWNEEDFLFHLRNRQIIGMVAEYDEIIVGFMVYMLQKESLQLINFAVHPLWSRNGFGRAMIDKLKHKLRIQRRTQIIDEVRETNLPMHLFLRSMGFECKGVERNACENGESAYRFIFQLQTA